MRVLVHQRCVQLLWFIFKAYENPVIGASDIKQHIAMGYSPPYFWWRVTQVLTNSFLMSYECFNSLHGAK